MNNKLSRNIFIYTFTVPTFLLFSFFIVYPMLSGAKYSLYVWSGVSSDAQFIGLANYTKLFHDPTIFLALKHDLYLMVLNIAGTMILSLALSGIIYLGEVKLAGLTQGILFFPSVTSVVIIAILWIMAYNPSFGVINSLLQLAGLQKEGIAFLGDKNMAFNAVILVKIWAGIGFFLVIFITAMKGIPTEMVEASVIDGASKITRFIKIIIPLIGGQINFSFIILLISSINAPYHVIQLMTAGGPNQATEVLATYFYKVGFSYGEFGYATAIGIMILVVTLLINLFYDKFLASRSYEY